MNRGFKIAAAVLGFVAVVLFLVGEGWATRSLRGCWVFGG